MKKKGMASLRKAGFTLIEVLVTIVIIGVLAAVVIPAVTSQASAGDSARVFSDLDNVRTGIENFDIAVKQFPGDVDDLVNSPGTSNSGTGQAIDADISGANFVSNTGWAGPYIETPLSSAATSSTASVSVSAFNTGYTATINNRFSTCAITVTTAACTATSPDYAVVLVNGLTAAQATSIDNLIDGSGAASTTGKFRYTSDAASSTGYYYATPFK